MKFKCDRDVLSEALTVVQRGISSRPGIPALTGVLLEARDDRLVLSSTDLELSTRIECEVGVSEPGSALVPARLVADIVKSLPQAPVEVEADSSQARIAAGSYEGTIRCLPVEDFPASREAEGIRVTVAAGEFAAGVQQVAKAASRDEARPILTGVLLEANREGLTMVATDSYRLAIRDVSATADGEAKALVPERALIEAGRAAATADRGEVEIRLEDGQATFRAGSLTLTTRLIEGEFPAYRQLLPDAYDNRLEVSRTGLLEAVRRVGLLARDNSPVRFEFNALGGVRLSSSSPDLGGSVEVVEAKYEGEELTVAFNPTYLSDGLSVTPGERAIVEVRDGLKPAVVRSEDESGFTYLVMPVRLPATVATG